jgi:hypothetical protein
MQYCTIDHDRKPVDRLVAVLSPTLYVALAAIGVFGALTLTSTTVGGVPSKSLALERPVQIIELAVAGGPETVSEAPMAVFHGVADDVFLSPYTSRTVPGASTSDRAERTSDRKPSDAGGSSGESKGGGKPGGSSTSGSDKTRDDDSENSEDSTPAATVVEFVPASAVKAEKTVEKAVVKSERIAEKAANVAEKTSDKAEKQSSKDESGKGKNKD